MVAWHPSVRRGHVPIWHFVHRLGLVVSLTCRAASCHARAYQRSRSSLFNRPQRYATERPSSFGVQSLSCSTVAIPRLVQRKASAVSAIQRDDLRARERLVVARPRRFPPFAARVSCELGPRPQHLAPGLQRLDDLGRRVVLAAQPHEARVVGLVDRSVEQSPRLDRVREELRVVAPRWLLLSAGRKLHDRITSVVSTRGQL